MGFVPRELIGSIQSSGLNITQDVVRMRIQRLGLPLRFSDIRELFASFSVKNLKQPEIDFLQGRVSSSVFMQNYFNPMWIADLKKRAIENVHDLLKMTARKSETAGIYFRKSKKANFRINNACENKKCHL